MVEHGIALDAGVADGGVCVLDGIVAGLEAYVEGLEGGGLQGGLVGGVVGVVEQEFDQLVEVVEAHVEALLRSGVGGGGACDRIDGFGGASDACYLVNEGACIADDGLIIGVGLEAVDDAGAELVERGEACLTGIDGRSVGLHGLVDEFDCGVGSEVLWCEHGQRQGGLAGVVLGAITCAEADKGVEVGDILSVACFGGGCHGARFLMR